MTDSKKAKDYNVENGEWFYAPRWDEVISCAFCGFEGIMSYTEKCWNCGYSLSFCPRCLKITCLNSPFVEFNVKKKRSSRATIHNGKVGFEKWRVSDNEALRILNILAKPVHF